MFGFEGAEPPEGRWAPRRKAGVQQTPGRVILDSSMVEHSAVNRVVVGSSPTRGAVAAATKARKHQCLRAFYYKQKKENARKKQAVKC